MSDLIYLVKKAIDSDDILHQLLRMAMLTQRIYHERTPTPNKDRAAESKIFYYYQEMFKDSTKHSSRWSKDVRF